MVIDMERFMKKHNVKVDDKSVSLEMGLEIEKGFIKHIVSVQSSFLSSEPSLDISFANKNYTMYGYNFDKPLTKRVRITVELLE